MRWQDDPPGRRLPSSPVPLPPSPSPSLRRPSPPQSVSPSPPPQRMMRQDPTAPDPLRLQERLRHLPVPPSQALSSLGIHAAARRNSRPSSSRGSSPTFAPARLIGWRRKPAALRRARFTCGCNKVMQAIHSLWSFRRTSAALVPSRVSPPKSKSVGTTRSSGYGAALARTGPANPAGRSGRRQLRCHMSRSSLRMGGGCEECGGPSHPLSGERICRR